MPRFAANLSMLYNEVPFLDRFEKAAKAGFRGVEFLFPYALPAHEIAARLKDNGLALALHNMPPGDWEGGERGIGCHPERTAEFRAGVGRAIEYATALGAPQCNCLAGKAPAGVDDAVLRATYVANLRYAAAEFKRAGLRVVIEPINNYDIPGFWLNKTDKAISIIEEVGADNLFLQYDVYHAQRYEGELGATMEKHIARIGHVQIADNPGRHEPGTGEINYGYVFRRLDELGYTGWVGCEYRPRTTTDAGLGWMPTP